MNLRSQTPTKTSDKVNVSTKQLRKWFHDNGGKERSLIENPLDRDKHERKRLKQVRNCYNLPISPNAPIAFYDEKWFYVTNRRRRIKTLLRILLEIFDLDMDEEDNDEEF